MDVLKTGTSEADNPEVSLFDSLYGEQSGEPDAPATAPDHPPSADANAASLGGLAVDAPPIEIAPITIAPDAARLDMDAPVSSGIASPGVASPGIDPTRPAPIAFEAPAMSLQDFATEVFGTRGEMVSAPAEASAFAAASATGEPGTDVIESSFAAVSSAPIGFDAPDALGAPLDPVDAGPPPAPSAFAVASTVADSVADTSPITTDSSPFSPDAVAPDPVSPGLVPPGNDGGIIEDGTIDDAIVLEGMTGIGDDLLPTRKPKRGLPVTTRGAPSTEDAPTVSGGLAQRAKMAGLVVLALASGFFGYRTFAPDGSGGSDGGAQAASLAGPPSAPQPDAAATSGLGAPLGAIEPTELAAAEVALRAVGLEAQTYFAETGTYALDAAAWDQVIDAPVVAPGSPVAQGAFSVVSDQDAACFQTATAGGASVAIGVTGQGLTFASDAAGASICSADASVLAGWAPSLAPSAG